MCAHVCVTRKLRLPLDGLVTAFVVRVAGLHELVLVDTPAQTQEIRNMVVLLLKDLPKQPGNAKHGNTHKTGS